MTTSTQTEKTRMQEVTLTHTLSSGGEYRATFCPEGGMNLQSFQRNGLEVIDSHTRPLFDERSAGLGALIGPHFHRRQTAILPKIENENRFPHIARVKAKGTQDPFSHGIARYAPWSFEATENRIDATLKGKDEWKGSSLAHLEGQDFTMQYQAELSEKGLKLKLSVVSDSESMVGTHFYYRLPVGAATITADTQPLYRDGSEWKPFPQEWSYRDHQLTWDLSQAADYGFQSFFNPCGGKILLTTSEYKLETHFSTGQAEQSWQLYRPKDASFVCIEPLSAKDPRRPVLSVSTVEIILNIHET